MKDSDILDLYFARDDRAIACTAMQYGTALLRLSGRFVSHEDAEECVNDTYLSAWNHIPPTRPEQFYAWLARVCRNFSFSRVRYEEAEKRHGEVIELSEELSQCIPDQRLRMEEEGKEIGEVMSSWLRTLKEEKRVMFLRRYWYGDSVAEVADFMGCSESKVKVTLHRLREQCRTYLDEKGVVL